MDSRFRGNDVDQETTLECENRNAQSESERMKARRRIAASAATDENRQRRLAPKTADGMSLGAQK